MKVNFFSDVDTNNVATGILPSQPTCRLVGHDDNVPITIVRFTADGKYCLTVGHDKKIILWNPSRLDPAYNASHSFDKARVGISNNNDDIAVTNLPRALPIQTYEDGIRYTPTALYINHDSTRMLIGSDKTAVLLDCITKKVMRQFHHHTAVINDISMFMSNNLDQVYTTASYDATVALWDARSSNTYRPIQVLKDAKDSVTSVIINADDNDAIVRTASVDGIIRTYDIRRGMLQCDNYGSPIVSMATSTKHDHSVSYLAASCLDGSIRITNELSDWNRNITTGITTTSTQLIICRDGHVAGRYALACCFLANGTTLLTGSENGTAVLYDITAGRNKKEVNTTTTTKDILTTITTLRMASIIREYSGHTAPTCAVAAHPKKNDVIITASYDGNCIVWANQSPKEYFQ